MPPESKRFRILSLDGGGIKGAFTAAVLTEWEKQSGKVVADHFDLIAGTSTGGIIALGLGLGLPASESRRAFWWYVCRWRRLEQLSGFGRRN
jgi:patatin-like phospholipase/acyl hydrolase